MFTGKAIWFSPKKPTKIQIEQIEAMGLDLVQSEGIHSLTSADDVKECLRLLSATARSLKASYAFGEFCPSLRSVADRRACTAVHVGDYGTQGLEMLESWGTPTHIRWVGVGALPVFGEGVDITPWVSHL